MDMLGLRRDMQMHAFVSDSRRRREHYGVPDVMTAG